MTTHTVPTATVKTWKMAHSYILDIVNGEGSIAWGVGNRYPEDYTAVKMPGHGPLGFDLHRNTGNGKLGPIVHRVCVHPTLGMVYA